MATAKIKKIEFAPPLSIPIPESMKALLLKKREIIQAANADLEKAEKLEAEAGILRQQGSAKAKKATIEGQAIIEVLLNEHQLLGKPHSLATELDVVIVDPN